MENSIEEDIEIIESIIEEYENCSVPEVDMQVDVTFREKQNNALNHILSDYKRVLKENEELLEVKVSASARNRILELEKENEELKKYKEYYSSARQLVDNNYIHKQKIKDIIDRIDYDIKKTKEIISKNTNIYASYRKNDYQIVRLRAMNTKSLDIKKRLQELLESEE